MDCLKVRRYEEIDAPGLKERLKEARIADGRSVQVLATLAGISTGYWYQLEGEGRKWVSLEVLESIEQVLGIDLGVKFD